MSKRNKVRTPPSPVAEVRDHMVENAFIEAQTREDGNCEYHMYFPAWAQREQTRRSLPHELGGRDTRDIGLPAEYSGNTEAKAGVNGLQTYFGMHIEKEAVEALKTRGVPVIETRGDAEDRVADIKRSLMRRQKDERAERVAGEFEVSHPEICEIIKQEGYKISPDFCSDQHSFMWIPSELVLPAERVDAVQEALQVAAPDAKISRKEISTSNPFKRAEALVLDGLVLEKILGRLMPKERVYTHFKEKEMASVLSDNPKAESLKATMQEQSELKALLGEKAYFWVSSAFSGKPSTPGAILFADKGDAEKCLELLHAVPGFERAVRGDVRRPPFTSLPKIDLSGCDLQNSLILPGFAGDVRMTVQEERGGYQGSLRRTQLEETMRERQPGEEVVVPRRSSNVHQIHQMVKSEHPEHPAFARDEQRGRF